MQLLSTVLPDNHNFFLFGDKHTGSRLSSKDGWEQLMDMLHSPYEGCRNNRAGHMGDVHEAITVDDKRFSREMMSEPLPLEQKKLAKQEIEPAKGLIEFIIEGNHDAALWRFGNLVKEICTELGIPYGTYTTKLTVKDKRGKMMYKLYATHGHKGITSTADDPKRRKGNMQLILKRHLRFKAGDCAVMVKGHTHKLMVCKPESELYLTDNGKRIMQNYTKWGQDEHYIHPDARWYGNTGSFLKMYGDGDSGYAERAEYDPVELGFLVLIVRDRKIVELRPHYLDI